MHSLNAAGLGRPGSLGVRVVAAEWMPPTVHIPPGVDTDRFTPLDPQRRGEVRERLGLSPSGLLVSSYSRLVPRKGMDTLIRASASLAPHFPQLQVAIGGSGRDRDRLERLAQRLHAPVIFLGRVADDDLSPWLGASDLTLTGALAVIMVISILMVIVGAVTIVSFPSRGSSCSVPIVIEIPPAALRRRRISASCARVSVSSMSFRRLSPETNNARPRPSGPPGRGGGRPQRARLRRIAAGGNHQRITAHWRSPRRRAS